MKGSFIRGLSASLTLHSCRVTLFALGSRLFFIQLQINTHTHTLTGDQFSTLLVNSILDLALSINNKQDNHTRRSDGAPEPDGAQ
jgi:hypothetical protein